MKAFTAGLIAQNLIEAIAVLAEIEGMKAANAQFSEDQPYSEKDFLKKSRQLHSIATMAREAGMRE